MPTIATKDGAEIFYKDWGKGKAVVFCHGWPLNADAWDDQLFFFASRGYRAIAHDRRGHGRSSQSWDGNDMDTYASDLATLLEKLEITGAFLVGHSTGGGEAAHYLGRYGSKRVAKLGLIAAVPPLMLKTESNPGGLPIGVFDDIRAQLLKDRAQYYRDLSAPFYGANRPNSRVSQGLLDQFWLQSMQAGLRAAFDCVKQFSEVDFTADLKAIDVPTLIVHGDDDQIVPIEASAQKTAKTLKRAVLEVYPGAPHGLVHTLKEKLNKELLAFVAG
jgi:non-heme chloroperoxidase